MATYLVGALRMRSVECIHTVMRSEKLATDRLTLSCEDSTGRRLSPWLEVFRYLLTLRARSTQCGLIGMGIPQKVIDVVMTWHQQAQYSIRHDDSARHIEASQGVRQGCSVAPTLWLIYSHLISVQLANAVGIKAANELLSIFADDYHCSTKFISLH